MTFNDVDALIETIISNAWLALAMMAAVLAAMSLLMRFFLKKLCERTAHRTSTFAVVFRASQSALSGAFLLFGLSVLLQTAPDTIAHIESARRLVTVALIVAISILASRAVTGMGDAIVQQHPYDIEDNYRARGILTQSRVLTRTLSSVIVVLGVAAGLMVFPNVRQIGAGLLASAGVIGIAVGLAAKPIIGNLLAGLQIAFTQPMRIDDVVVVENEWGRIEEITRSYVVVKIWDERRLVIPLQYFIENPFQNWTRGSAALLGTVFLWLDYQMPIEPLRVELKRLCAADPDWDQRVAIVQVTDASEKCLQIRALVSSANSSRNFDLRCRVREGLISFVQREYPNFLAKFRADVSVPAVSAGSGMKGGPVAFQSG